MRAKGGGRASIKGGAEMGFRRAGLGHTWASLSAMVAVNERQREEKNRGKKLEVVG